MLNILIGAFFPAQALRAYFWQILRQNDVDPTGLPYGALVELVDNAIRIGKFSATGTNPWRAQAMSTLEAYAMVIGKAHRVGEHGLSDQMRNSKMVEKIRDTFQRHGHSFFEA